MNKLNKIIGIFFVLFLLLSTFVLAEETEEEVVENIQLNLIYIFLVIFIFIITSFFLFSSFKREHIELQLNFRLLVVSSLVLVGSFIIEMFSKSEVFVLYLDRMVYISAYFIIFFLMLFIFRITKSKIKKSASKLLYLFSIIISSLILFTNLFVRSAVYEPNKYFFVKTNYGVLFNGFVVLLLFYLVITLIVFIKNYIKNKTKTLKTFLLNLIFVFFTTILNITYYMVIIDYNPLLILVSTLFFVLSIGITIIKLGFIRFDKNIIMSLLVISFFLIIMMFVYNTYRTTENLKEQAIDSAKDSLISGAFSKKYNIETSLDSYQKIVYMISTGEIYRNTFDENIDYNIRIEQINKRMESMIESYDEISRIRILDKNGIVFASSNDDIDIDKSNQEIFLKGKEEVHIGEIHRSNLTEKIVISISAPLFLNEEFVGVLVINFDVDSFYESLTIRSGLGQTGEIYLVNKDKLFISPSRYLEDTFLKQIVDTEQVNICISEHVEKGLEELPESQLRYSIYKNYLGANVIGVHYYIPEMNWCMISEISEQEVINDVQKVANEIWIFTLITIVFIVLIGINTTVLLTKSLKQEVDTKTKELTELNLSLEDKIRERTKQLKQHEEELNLIVKRRTDELNIKIKEQENASSATFNILEDVEESRNELEVAQKELKKTIKELEIMDRKRDEFISITAHELKTPLTSIHGFSDLLQNPAIANNEEKRNSFLKIIGEDTDRLSKLVTDILDLSRMDIGTIKFDNVDLNVKEFIEKVKRQLDILIKSKKINSKYNVEDNLPNLLIDESRLMQIITNFITNAIKYTQEGEKITIDARRDGEKIKISVIDNGKGIPKEEHDKIFERFYQVDSSYTRKAGGSGLGLAICKELAQAMGGEIKLESEVDKGSTFSVTFPIKK